ncbi:PrsW family intramembrane metalloprotease [Haloglomus litoreum]|uniref:PrsW family intramembrane metalloprotease n=1 Tax=Haloglomus litoreum TaxID=3034026 RepID=UPI0023E8F6EB|nr:PrsW family intramembrane metalloprotease [Haloglomus sp. DT116]
MRPRKVLRIARWEVTKHAGGLDRRTVAVAVVALLFAFALAPAVAGGGFALDDGIYRVGVADDSVFHPAVASDDTFRIVEPEPGLVAAGEADLLIREGSFVVADSEKGRAAVAELRTTVQQFNDRRMLDESNASAAYPVFPVSLQYAERDSGDVTDGGDGGSGGDGGDGGSGGGDGGSGGDGGGGGDGGDGGGGGGLPSGGGGGQFGVPGLSGGIFGGGTSNGTPGDLAPPFPFGSLVLAFVFVIPLNFVIQAYGSSVLSERLNRRGELLLVAPVKPREIVAGKTLPYFAGAVLITGAITGLITLSAGGGSLLSVVAVAALALLFLAASFVGAMFARSFKELTFVTVAISVLLMTFAFVPAIFTDVGSVALISPLTLVVRDLTGASVGPGGIAFALLPTTLTALLLFALGTGVYREEDMFTQRPVHLKAMDALAARISRPRSLTLVVAALVPFVFVAELLAVALLFALPGGLSIVLLLTVVAVIEELAKSLPVYAGFLHARYERTARAAALAGGFAGLGFFLAEKFTLIVQVVGLDRQISEGSAVFQTGANAGPAVALLLLLAPLALHVVTTTLSALGATRSRDGYALGLTAAIALHIAYNLSVVIFLV